MIFDIHLLTNTDKFIYAGICEETGHVIYFSEHYLQVLPPSSIRFPSNDHLPTSRSFELDCRFLDALVGDHMGKLTFSLLIRFYETRHITVKYYNERGEHKRTIEMQPGFSRGIDKTIEYVYSIMEQVRDKVFETSEE